MRRIAITVVVFAVALASGVDGPGRVPVRAAPAMDARCERRKHVQPELARELLHDVRIGLRQDGDVHQEHDLRLAQHEARHGSDYLETYAPFDGTYKAHCVSHSYFWGSCNVR